MSHTGEGWLYEWHGPIKNSSVQFQYNYYFLSSITFFFCYAYEYSYINFPDQEQEDLQVTLFYLTSVYRPLKLKLPFLHHLHHSASRSIAGEEFILKVKAILGRLLNTTWLLSSDEFNGKHWCHESLNWSVPLKGMMEDVCSVYWTFSSSPHPSVLACY